MGLLSAPARALTQDLSAIAIGDDPWRDGDIVVTARTTSERLQDTPVSITALPAAELERRGINTIADVAKVTPGLNYLDFGDLKLSPAALFGKNVTGKTYVTRRFDLSGQPLNGQKLITLGDPLTYGIAYRLKFG